MLGRAAFEATMVAPMRNVTETAEALVDLWEYADPVLKSLYPEKSADDWSVELIYESGDGAHQHLLVRTDNANVYIVFVVSVPNRSILGHHILDLGELYGV